MTKKQKEQKARAMHNYPACFYAEHEQRRAFCHYMGYDLATIEAAGNFPKTWKEAIDRFK